MDLALTTRPPRHAQALAFCRWAPRAPRHPTPAGRQLRPPREHFPSLIAQVSLPRCVTTQAPGHHHLLSKNILGGEARHAPRGADSPPCPALHPHPSGYPSAPDLRRPCGPKHPIGRATPTRGVPEPSPSGQDTRPSPESQRHNLLANTLTLTPHDPTARGHSLLHSSRHKTGHSRFPAPVQINKPSQGLAARAKENGRPLRDARHTCPYKRIRRLPR